MKKLLIVLILFAFLQPVFSQKNTRFSPAQLAQLAQLFEPAKKKLEESMKKLDLKKYNAYQEGLKKLDNLKKTEEIKKGLEALKKQYGDFLSNAYTNAKIDEKYYKTAVLRILANFNNLQFGQFLTFLTTAPPSSGNSSAGADCSTFKCKFEVRDNETVADGRQLCYGFFEAYDDDCGLSSSSCSMGLFFDARGKNHIAMGENVQIKPNIQKVEISSFVPKYELACSALSGYSYAECGLVFTGEDARPQFFTYDYVSAYAPFGITDSRSSFQKSNQLIKTSFVPPSSGGNYKIQVFVQTIIRRDAVGNADADVHLQHPESIKVCQIPK